jgi:peptidoglycan/xylan/chitin deacetylase (PgdA/CDA1 family)
MIREAHYRLLPLLFPHWTWALPRGGKRIALTFDDGPHPQTTPALLRALDVNGITATMFLGGEQCVERVSLLKEIESAGHAIANHGYHHIRHALRGRRFQTESILQTEEVLQTGGISMQRLYRPPFGSFDLTTGSILKEYGYKGIVWSLIAWDWTNQTTDRLWRRIESQLHDGAIIVLHDGHPTTLNMIEVLPRLADAVGDRGWSFTKLTSLGLSLPPP